MGLNRGARIRRFIGAAGLALMVAGGPLAGPAAAAELDQFAGSSTGYALRVTLDVRPLIQQVPALQGVLDQVWASVPGQSGAFPGVIDQTFIKTTSDADGTVSKARSVLAEGLVDLDVVEATKAGQSVEKTVQTVQLPDADMALIDGTVGKLTAKVTDAPAVDGTGSLANVGVQLPLAGLDTAIVTDLLAELQAVIDDVSAELTTQLDGILGGGGSSAIADQLSGTIGDIADQLPDDSPVIGGLTDGLGLTDPAELVDEATVEAALDTLLDPAALVQQITDILEDSLLQGALADLEGLVNITKAAKTGDGKAIASSAAELAELNVLGGLVDVGVLKLSSSSEAAGIAGSAKNTSSCSIGDVKVGGDTLAVSLDGSNLYVNGQAVPVVGDALAQLKDVADLILGTAGIDVGLCEAAQVEAEDDGTAAAQRVSALRVEVAPLGLFNLVIDPTVETSVAAQVAVAQQEETPTLPRTGAASVATVLSGLGLAVSAFFLRKRLR